MQQEIQVSPEIMTIEEVADFLRIHKNQVYRLMNEDLPFFFIGRQDRRIYRTSLVTWIAEREQRAKEAQAESR